MIKYFKPAAYRWSVIGLLVFTLLGCATLTNGQGPASTDPEANTSKVADQTSSQTDSSTNHHVNTTIALQHIDMINESTGWALQNTKLLHTEDGGLTWMDVTPVEMKKLPQVNGPFVQFLNDRTAYMMMPQMNDKAVFFKTADAGNHWTQYNVDFSQYPQAVIRSWNFSDLSHGWFMISEGVATGSEGIVLYQTSDGGEHWKKQSSYSDDSLPLGGLKTGISFTNEKDGFLTGLDYGDELYLYASHDGGSHWARQKLDIPSGYSADGGSSTTLPPIFVSDDEFDDQHGFLPVHFRQDPFALIVYRTTDGGRSWHPTIPIEPADQNNMSYSFVDSKHIYVSDGSNLFSSNDSGETWKKIHYKLTVNLPITQIDFVSDKLGFALQDNHLLITTDGGKTWSR